MAFPENLLLEIPNDGAGNAIVGTSDIVRIDQMSDKGYDFIRAAGATFVGNLEGSVSMRNWTTIAALAASGQGAVGAHYNYVRVKIGTAGVLGATTELFVGGKVL